MDLVVIHEDVRHPLDPHRRYWLVTRRCFEQLWQEATVSPGCENNILYLHKELR